MTLELYGALNMMTDLNDPECLSNNAQITLYKYHNEVFAPINYAIYKFEFAVEKEEEVSLWSEQNPYGRNFGQFREGVYFYRPPQYSDGDVPVLLSIERVTRAELATDPMIPKIEVVLTPAKPEMMDQPGWWTQLWAEELMREYAPKWICEHHAVRRIGKHFVVAYIPAVVTTEKLESLSKARNVIEELVEAINCNFKGLQRNLF